MPEENEWRICRHEVCLGAIKSLVFSFMVQSVALPIFLYLASFVAVFGFTVILLVLSLRARQWR